MVAKLINFRCPDELLNAIENYGRERYPTTPSKRGSIDYDQSKAIRDMLVAGLEALTKGEVKIELEVRQPRQQPDGIEIDIDAITAQISLQFEERFNRLEARLEEALKPSMRKRLVS